MSSIQIHDKLFVPYISRDAIQARIKELAAEIDEAYAGLNPLFICILNGTFIFASDIFRAVTVQAEISFVRLSSYDGMSSTGNVANVMGLKENPEGRHVIVLEDIIDTGKTLYSFMPQLMQLRPASLKLACLLSKPDALQFDVKADYTGFVIPDNFVVGYGLDYNGLGRNLPDIYTLAD